MNRIVLFVLIPLVGALLVVLALKGIDNGNAKTKVRQVDLSTPEKEIVRVVEEYCRLSRTGRADLLPPILTEPPTTYWRVVFPRDEQAGPARKGQRVVKVEEPEPIKHLWYAVASRSIPTLIFERRLEPRRFVRLWIDGKDGRARVRLTSQDDELSFEQDFLLTEVEGRWKIFSVQEPGEVNGFPKNFDSSIEIPKRVTESE